MKFNFLPFAFSICMLIACGDDSESSSDVTSSPTEEEENRDTSKVETEDDASEDAKQDSSKKELSPEKKLSFKNLAIDIPAGALNEDANISATFFSDLEQVDLPSLPSKVYGGVKFSPEGLVFNTPVQVEMTLSQKPESDSLAIVYYNEKTGEWELSDVGIVSGDKVSFYVQHFSHYIAIESEWLTLFELFDGYANIAIKEGATTANLSEMSEKFLKNIDEKMNFKNLKSPFTFRDGDDQKVCLATAGYSAEYLFQEDSTNAGSAVQGLAMYRSTSSDLVMVLSMLDRLISEVKHKDETVSSEQTIRYRRLSIYFEPCAGDLSATAEKPGINAGESSSIDVKTTCGGTPLKGYVIDVTTSPNMTVNKESVSSDEKGSASVVATKKDDEPGWVTFTTKSPADENIVDSLTVNFAKESWEATINLTETYKDQIAGGEFSLDYTINTEFTLSKMEYEGDTLLGFETMSSVKHSGKATYSGAENDDMKQEITDFKTHDVQVKTVGSAQQGEHPALAVSFDMEKDGSDWLMNPIATFSSAIYMLDGEYGWIEFEEGEVGVCPPMLFFTLEEGTFTLENVPISPNTDSAKLKQQLMLESKPHYNVVFNPVNLTEMMLLFTPFAEEDDMVSITISGKITLKKK